MSPHEIMHATYLLLYGNAMLGRWSKVDGLLEEHLRAYRAEFDMTCPYVRSGPMVGALVLARRGEVERAREISSMMPLDEEKPALPEAWQAMVTLAIGDSATALARAKTLVGLERLPTQEEALFELLVMARWLSQATRKRSAPFCRRRAAWNRPWHCWAPAPIGLRLDLRF